MELCCLKDEMCQEQISKAWDTEAMQLESQRGFSKVEAEGTQQELGALLLF